MIQIPGDTKILQHFYLASIAAYENDKILIVLWKDALWKALQKLFNEIPSDLF